VRATSETVVQGVVGQPVTLPCSYQVAREKDISDVCWGRGPCPNSKCNDKILHTTGSRVTFRTSPRYNLQGYISYGDVSLTIQDVQAEDAGTYCCRVEIPGWFNDIKQNIRLVVIRAPPVKTTTMRQGPTTSNYFRKTTFGPQATSDLVATTQTAALLTTLPPAAPATTESPAVVTVGTVAPPTFDVTASDTFPETEVATNALPNFSTDFQATDVRTEGDGIFCSTESIPLPEVTTEFPSTRLTADRTQGANSSLVMEDVPTVATAPPAPTTLPTLELTLGPSETSSSSDGNAKKAGVKPPFSISIILSVSLIGVSILLILMLSSLLWKRKYVRKFILERLGPREDLEKVFSGAEGENNLFVL
ncbi:TIMD4 protein, partial [Alectura lathami]|nr:TIMD4 protein [Alectura lathami]